MPTDGQDFPKRKKFYGAAYTAAKQGGSPADVAPIACAGIARDLRSAPIPWLSQAIDLVSNDSQNLIRLSPAELHNKLRVIAEDLSNHNTMVCFSALRRIAGRLSNEGAQASPEQVTKLLAGELFQGLVIEKDLPGYLRHHQGREASEDEAIARELSDAAEPYINEVMRSAYSGKNGRPAKFLETPCGDLPKIDSSSIDSLTSTSLVP